MVEKHSMHIITFWKNANLHGGELANRVMCPFPSFDRGNYIDVVHDDYFRHTPNALAKSYN